MSGRHVVQDLRFEADFATEEQAFELQDRVAQFAAGRAVREMDEVFSQVCGPGQVLRLQNLELDLGWLDPADDEHTWARQLRQALQEALAHPESSGEATPRPIGEAEDRWATLCHVLRHGQWPWHAGEHDIATLAEWQWRHDPQALQAWLHRADTPPAARRRLALQAPAVWRALQGPLSGQSSGSLSGPWQSPLNGRLTRPPAPLPGEAGRTPALRRLAALLEDDTPTLDEDEQAELLALWASLVAADTAALRQLLRRHGLQARVRRRIARAWPQALLRQLPALWLPRSEAEHFLRVVRQSAADTLASREAWARVLGALLAPSHSGPETHPTADALLQAWHPAPQDLPDWQADAERHAPWPQLRHQSARGSRESFAAWLAQALPGPWPAADEAQALADLAFGELPLAWQQAAAAAPADAALRVQWALEHLQAIHPATPTSQELARLWWRRLSARALCSPDEWLQALHRTASASASDQARRSAWQRWLPPLAPSTGPVGQAVPPMPLAALSGPAWQDLLHAFLSVHEAHLLQQALLSLAAVARGATALGVLRRAALSALLWQAAGVAGAVAAAAQALAHAQDEPLTELARRAADHAARAGNPGAADHLLATAALTPAAGAVAHVLGQHRHRGALLRLANALAAAPAGRWDDVAADWATLRQSEPAALRALLHQQLGQAADRERVLAWLPDSAWAEWLSLLLPAAPLLARAAALLSRDQGPHVTVAGRSRVLAWVLAGPMAEGGAAAERQALCALLVQLAAWQGCAPARLARRAAQRAEGADAVFLAQGARALVHGAAPEAPWPAPELARWLQGSAAAARQALRLHAAQPAARRALAQQLQAPLLEAFLALYLPTEAPDLAALLRLLTLQMGGGPETPLAHGAGARPPQRADLQRAELQLAELLLCTLPQEPQPQVRTLLGSVLDLAARQAQQALPVLARRLQVQAQLVGLPTALLAPWLVRTAPVSIATPPPTPPSAPLAAPPTGRPPDADPALTAVVAHLRGQDADATALRQHWQALALSGAEPARQRLARELESPLAAERLSALLPAEPLVQAITWLRPADGAALRRAWPALQALPAPAPRGWPEVARAVLRELFQEGRVLNVAGLLQRTAQALQRWAAPTVTETLVAAAPDEPVFVHNAGLVLAGPYLPRLFTVLDLVREKAFVDDEAAARGCLLLQHLVTGEAAAPEPELALNKLLCGLPLAQPVPRVLALTPAEREATDGLLLAMIGHWKALGHTSPAGLRQTFLQREGRLTHADGAWQLQVPTQTFDMLLDRLPWGYSTAKFPWMPEVLHVQWR